MSASKPQRQSRLRAWIGPETLVVEVATLSAAKAPHCSFSRSWCLCGAMLRDPLEANGHSKRRSERNVQRRTDASGHSSDAVREADEQLADEDADLIERLKALRGSGRAPALVARAARQVEKEQDGSAAGRGAGPVRAMGYGGQGDNGASHRKSRSARPESVERPAREVRDKRTEMQGSTVERGAAVSSLITTASA